MMGALLREGSVRIDRMHDEKGGEPSDPTGGRVGRMGMGGMRRDGRGRDDRPLEP